MSLEVPTGSLTALLGPSGGGKSTLLRIIAGLDTPDAGTVRIEGEDLTATPARSRGVGFCFQHYAPFRHLTVRRNVAFGLEIRHRPKAEVKARVDELLELVGLAHLGDRYPSQLSGGQRQRMALARALAIEPKVLLLDEPFGALDAQVRTQLRLWLRDLHDTLSVTTVLVTHDQEEAMEVADRLAIINHGRLEQVGTPADMYDHPANEFVLTFLGPATQLDGEWVRPHDLVVHTVEDGKPTPRRGRARWPASPISASRSRWTWTSPAAVPAGSSSAGAARRSSACRPVSRCGWRGPTRPSRRPASRSSAPERRRQRQRRLLLLIGVPRRGRPHPSSERAALSVRCGTTSAERGLITVRCGGRGGPTRPRSLPRPFGRGPNSEKQESAADATQQIDNVRAPVTAASAGRPAAARRPGQITWVSFGPNERLHPRNRHHLPRNFVGRLWGP